MVTKKQQRPTKKRYSHPVARASPLCATERRGGVRDAVAGRRLRARECDRLRLPLRLCILFLLQRSLVFRELFFLLSLRYHAIRAVASLDGEEHRAKLSEPFCGDRGDALHVLLRREDELVVADVVGGMPAVRLRGRNGGMFGWGGEGEARVWLAGTKSLQRHTAIGEEK